MNITLCSAFRNSVANEHLDKYLEQVTGLHLALSKRGDRLHCVWGEGDSTDDTLAHLRWVAEYAQWPIALVDCTHGGADYPSIVLAERFQQLAQVGRCIWAAIPADADAVVYVESDLIWDAETLVALIDRLADYPAISPMVLLDRKGWGKGVSFYDTFVFRKDGKHFEHYPPYHACYVSNKPFAVDSAGSVMAFRGDIARRIVFGEDTIFLGICQQVYEMGYSVWVDPTLKVIHE